ncbi:MAG: hypothetical protein EOO90_22920 [Pedobacter sp.]|nr:MAG: hypothetical protein EOO90_22920 [Pedobacter sp.]
MKMKFSLINNKALVMLLFIVYLSTNTFAQPKTFSETAVLQNAKNLDATMVDNFREGYAIIRKGEAFAIIDKTGNFLVPYGKYKFNKPRGFEIDRDRCGFYQGMCVVRDVDSEQYGYINNKGILVIPCTLNDAEPFKADGFAYGKHKNAQGQDERVYIDRAGIKYRIKDQSLYERNQNDAYPLSANGYLEYYNKKGKLLFKTKRHRNGVFSEGLIVVDTTYELAGGKAGYMDLAGKLAIPYKFKGSLAGFSDGLARYEPPTSDEFKYIYINKQGEQVIKLRDTEKFKNIFFGNSYFSGGYALGTNSYGRPILLSKSGEMNFFDEMIVANNPEFTKNFTKFTVNTFGLERHGDFVWFEASMEYEVMEDFITGGIGGGQKISKKTTKTMRGSGVADLNGKMVIPPIYNNVGGYDPVSGLAKVFYYIARDGNSTEVSGYANKDSQVVMIYSRKNL